MGVPANQQQLLSLLYTFSVAARHLSFTDAAEELFLTQGAISQRIKKLEGLLKFNLFIRKTRRLELTPEGSYRVLLSRGRSGLVIKCDDQETYRYLKSCGMKIL